MNHSIINMLIISFYLSRGKSMVKARRIFFMLFADLFSYEPESVGSGSSSKAAFFHGRRVLLDFMT